MWVKHLSTQVLGNHTRTGVRTGPTEFIGLREHVPLVHDVHRRHCLGDDLLVLVIVLVVVIFDLPFEFLQQLEAAHHDVSP